jgi:membrane-associated phospholipid phosphatase
MEMDVHNTDAAARKHRHVAALALAAVSLLLCSAYALANQLTRGRTDVGTAVFAWERSIPFIDWTIVPYLSIVLFFAGAFFLCRDRAQLRVLVLRVLMVLAVSLACFALWPLRFTFERPPTAGVIGALFDLLHYVDLPYNRAPSLHVSMVVILWALYAERLRGALRLAAGVWFGLIAVSVLTTYQHHVIDVPAGVLAGWFCVWLFPSPRRAAVPARIAAQTASWQGVRAPRASAS